MKVADLAAFRAGREQAEALQQTVTPREQLDQTHPAHAIYVHAQKQTSIMAEQLLQLPDMKSFVKQIASAEDDYMPSWPPMSPISKSLFVCWSTYDLPVGARRETIGNVTLAVAMEFGTHPALVALMQTLQDSRMGIYRVERQDGVRVQLRDLATDRPCAAICQSGYSGRAGELWYTRVLPPPFPGADHVVFTSPYVILAPDVTAWMAYLDRWASKTLAGTRQEVLEQHFKWGAAARYWLDFVFEAYSRHEPGAIFLHGLPDVPESRPHSPAYEPRPARSATAEGEIHVQARQLGPERKPAALEEAATDLRGGQTTQIDLSFPDRKISEAFLEFAEPLLVKEQGPPPRPEEVESVLSLASTVWNAVVLDTVRGNTDWTTKVRKQVAEQPPLAGLMEQMILRKKCMFGHDLRLIGEYKVSEHDGEWRLRVEARAPTAR
jgi:hypothetical protein